MPALDLPDADRIKTRIAEIDAERLTVDADLMAEIERNRAALHADEYGKLLKILKALHVPKRRGPRKTSTDSSTPLLDGQGSPETTPDDDSATDAASETGNAGDGTPGGFPVAETAHAGRPKRQHPHGAIE